MAATRGVKHTKRPEKAFAALACLIVAVLAVSIRSRSRATAGALKIPVIVIEAFPASLRDLVPGALEGAPFICLQEGDDSAAIEVPPGCRWAILLADGAGARPVRWIHSGWQPVRRVRLGEGSGSREVVSARLPRCRMLVAPGGWKTGGWIVLAPGESWGDTVPGGPSCDATIVRALNLGLVNAITAVGDGDRMGSTAEGGLPSDDPLAFAR